jgi:hypothetical protein
LRDPDERAAGWPVDLLVTAIEAPTPWRRGPAL